MSKDLYVFGEGNAKGGRGTDLSTDQWVFLAGHVCLKIFNSAGDELSVSFDDSCGAFKHLQRVELAVFKKEKLSTAAYQEYHIGAKELLENLAAHLGYGLVKSSPEKDYQR